MELNRRRGHHGLLRDHNRALVIGLLRHRGPLSRAELSRITGLAPSALSRLAARLLEEGVVVEVGKGESQKGRPPIMLSLNPDHASSIGVKIEAHRVLAARVDITGRVREEVSVPFSNPAPDEVLSAAEEAIAAVWEGEILGIGVAVSGVVDSNRGLCLFSPILQWHRVKISAPLGQRFGAEVHVENDVNALTLAEARYGAGKGFSDFVCVTVGEGLGAGIVIGGRLFRGAFGGAGEFGHILFDPAGPRCRCGEQGCLELFASDRFLLRRASALGISLEELSERARSGDPEAVEIFHELGRNLGHGLKALVNLLNPEAVLIGGERTSSEGDLFLPVAERVLKEHAFPGTAERIRVARASLGEEGFLIGAAEVFIERFFSAPMEVGVC